MQPKQFDIKINQTMFFSNMVNQAKKIDRLETTYFEVNEVYDNVFVPVIKYEIFEQYKDLLAGFSTRLGGVSEKHLSSMNLSFSRGDEYNNVIENHKRFSYACEYNYEKSVFSDQIHETKIKIVTKEDAGKGIVHESDIKGIDGLITNIYDLPLLTFYADCVPLYLYDPVKKVIGLAHSGWRGTVLGMGKKMVLKMEEEFGSVPSDIICAIGPSICVNCYEVSKDVAEKFMSFYNDEEIDKILFQKNDDKYQLDLHEACFRNFVRAGVLPQNISKPDLCTKCNNQILFSHRATNGKRGNLAAVMMLRG